MNRVDRSLVFACVAALSFLAVGTRAARAEDEEATRVRGALVEAVAAKDPVRVSRVLDEANALVGPSATFPDVGALADWLGLLPDPVVAQPAVRDRRAWLYVTAKRGADALPLLEAALEKNPRNAIFLAYRGEARRQAGDLAGAVADLVAALDAGAPDEHVLPSARKIVYDLRKDPPKGLVEGLPPYATVAAPILAKREMTDVREALVAWLSYDASTKKGDAHGAAVLRAEAVRQAFLALRAPTAKEDRARRARMALDAGGWARSLGADAPADLPTAFDLYAQAVRLGERPGEEGHDLPEALTALAEEALAKGRYVLAARMAHRRLAISDSPAARRVLRGLPPDVGD